MSNKPGWVRDAVATDVGWVNPKTNEVLSITRGLDNALPFVRGQIVWPEPVATVIDVPELNTFSELAEVSSGDQIEDKKTRRVKK